MYKVIGLIFIFLISGGVVGQLLPDRVTGPIITPNCELEYQFNIRSLCPAGQVSICTFNVDFGDGSPVQNFPAGLIYHTYSVSGTYTVTVTAVSGSGASNWTGTFYAYGSTGTGVLPVITSTESGGVHSVTYEGYDLNIGPDSSSLELDWGDGTIYTVPNGTLTTNSLLSTHTYAAPGNYTIVATHTFINGDTTCSWTYSLTSTSSGDPCCSNFAPIPGERYWISAWVLEEHPNQVKNYTNAKIQVEFLGGATSYVNFTPSGDIIDGWQRIVGDFTVPSGSTDLLLHLVNESGTIPAYFDDVRVHPFNASMKSYVYDPETLWLTAELDDNNYATFYEYDKEGQLIRIKKETARGIMTIQESRSNNPKD